MTCSKCSEKRRKDYLNKKIQTECKPLRKLDSLGRIIIAKSIRQQLGITEGDMLTMEVNENRQIVLTKVGNKE